MSERTTTPTDVPEDAVDSPVADHAAQDGGNALAIVRRVIRRYPNLGLFMCTVGFIVLTAITHPAFGSEVNIRNLVRDWAILAIAAAGGMIVILIGGIDLSVSANIALIAVAASEFSNSMSAPLALLLALGIGAGVGIVNAIMVAYLRIDSVIVTIGMMQILTGLAFLWTQGAPIQAQGSSFTTLGIATAFGPVAYPTLIAIPLLIVMWAFLSRTSWGRYIYGIGGSQDAARASGIPVERYKALAFVLCGLLSGLAGILLASRVGGASATLGSDVLINSVAAIFIGGVAFGGGVGGVGGVALGALLITAIQNGLSFFGINSFLQMIITGGVLLVALFLNGFRRAA
jgi:ribose transport system permease protein